MKFNVKQRILLIAYALVIVIMCVFFVPNKIERYYGENVIHKTYRYSTYLPIWYNYKDNNIGSTDRNAIDYPKLITQIFAATVLFGTGILITKDAKKG